MARDGRATITLEQVREVATGGRRRFDKGGEQFYDQISALHKAVRGTDPDAACTGWRACSTAVAILTTWRGACCAWRSRTSASRIRAVSRSRSMPGRPTSGSAVPKASSPSPTRVVYLAVAPKSNAAYVAYGEARADVEQFGTLDVPLRFRNAPTRLMKDLGYGDGLPLRAR